MLLELFAAGALAAEPVWVEVEHSPPEAIPLFSSASVTTLKGVHKGDDCQAAAADALRQGEALGRVLRVVSSPTDLASAGTVACKQRMAGADVSASVVQLNLLVVQPELVSANFPELPLERAIQIAGMLSVLSGQPGEMAPIISEGGKAWVHVRLTAEHAPVDVVRHDAPARSTKAFVSSGRPWVVQWVQVLRGMPEVEGALIEVLAPATDPRKRGRRATYWEQFRFALATDSARRFQSGELMTEDLIAEMRVEHAPSSGSVQFQTVALEP